MADTCTTKSNPIRHPTINDVTPTKRLPQHKVEPSTSSAGEKVGGSLSIDCCSDPYSCMTLYDVLKSFNAPVSEEQMWALIYQSVKLYRDALQHSDYSFKELRAPASPHNLNIHKDGSVHVSFGSNGESSFSRFHFYIVKGTRTWTDGKGIEVTITGSRLYIIPTEMIFFIDCFCNRRLLMHSICFEHSEDNMMKL